MAAVVRDDEVVQVKLDREAESGKFAPMADMVVKPLPNHGASRMSMVRTWFANLSFRGKVMFVFGIFALFVSVTVSVAVLSAASRLGQEECSDEVFGLRSVPSTAVEPSVYNIIWGQNLCVTHGAELGTLRLEVCAGQESQKWSFSPNLSHFASGGFCIDLGGHIPAISPCGNPVNDTNVAFNVFGRLVDSSGLRCVHVEDDMSLSFREPVFYDEDDIEFSDPCDVDNPEQRLSLTPVPKMKLRLQESGLCLDHAGLGERISLSDCETSSSWILTEGKLKTGGNLCVDASRVRFPILIDCSTIDESAGEIWLNQFGRLATTEGKCFQMNSETSEVSFEGTCQAPVDLQTLLQIPFTARLQTRCGTMCVTTNTVNASLHLAPCAGLFGQNWLFQEGKISSGGFCAQPDGRAALCSEITSSEQVAQFSDGRLIFPNLGVCLEADRDGESLQANSESSCGKKKSQDIFAIPKTCNNAAVADGCCTSSAPCGTGEGICSGDADCIGSLVCGVPGNCRSFNLWGTAEDRCCEPGPARPCIVETFEELEEQVEKCPSGLIQIDRNIFFPRVIGIPAGVVIEIESTERIEEEQSGNAILEMDTSNSFFFVASGSLSLASLDFFNNASAAGGIQVNGPESLLEIVDCNFDLTGVTVDVNDGGRMLSVGGSLKTTDTQTNTVNGCDTCDLAFSNTRLAVQNEFVPQIKTARSLDLTGLRVDLGLVRGEGIDRRRRLQATQGVLDQGALKEINVRDVRKVYDSYFNCTDFDELISFEIAGPPACSIACDNVDACKGYLFQPNLDPVDDPAEEALITAAVENAANVEDLLRRNGTCVLFSSVDRDSCLPFDQDIGVTLEVFRVFTSGQQFDTAFEVYEHQSGLRVEIPQCIRVADVVAVIQDVASPQQCRVWCKFYAPLCRAAEYDDAAQLCLLGETIRQELANDCASSLAVDMLPPQGEFVRIGSSCVPQGNASLLRGIDGSLDACGSFCEIYGEGCVAVELDRTTHDCRLMSPDELLPVHFTERCRTNSSSLEATYELLVSEEDEVLHFPKFQYVDHITADKKFCSVATDLPESFIRSTSSFYINCKETCAKTQGCAAVDLRNFDGSSYECHFKSSAAFAPCENQAAEGDFLLLMSNVTTFESQATTSISPALVEAGMSFPGCQAMCWLDEDCDFFVFDVENRTCTTQTSPDYAAFDEITLGNVTAENVFHVREETFNTSYANYVAYSGQLFLFGEMTQLDADEERECRLLCTHNILCQYWKFEEAGMCRMFKGANTDPNAPGPMLQEIQTSTLRYRFQSDAQIQREYRNVTATHYPLGDPLPSADVIGVRRIEDCMTLCEIHRFCGAFSFNSSTSECNFFTSAFRFSELSNNGFQVIEPQVYLAESEFDFDPVPGEFCLFGVEIEAIQDVTLEECKSACQNRYVGMNERCESLRYDYALGECNLHRGLELSLVSDGGCGNLIGENVTSFRSVEKFIEPNEAFVNVTDACPLFEEASILKIFTDRPSLASCQRMCRLEKECLAVLYNATLRVCELHDSAAYLKTSDCPGEMSIKFESDKFTLDSGTCPKGNVLVELEASVGECGIYCDALFACRAFVLNSFNSTCSLLDSPWGYPVSNCTGGSTVEGNLFIEDSQLFYTRDDGECGGNSLDSTVQPIDLLELDECQAVCAAYGPGCHGVNYNRVTMQCELQGPLEEAACSAFGQTCSCAAEETLYISFRHAKIGYLNAKFIPFRACHGLSAFSAQENLTGSLDRCMRACGQRDGCRTVSRTESGICVLGGEDFDPYISGTCDDVLFRRPINRYGELIDITIQESDKKAIYFDKTPDECKALCTSKNDCVDVMRPITCPGEIAERLMCELSDTRAYSVSPDNGTYCETEPGSRPANVRDLSLFKTRWIFAQDRAQICVSEVGILESTNGVLDWEDCAELCLDTVSCAGFEYGSNALSSSSCTTFNTSNPAVFSSCVQGSLVAGTFYERSPVQLQTLTESELNARLWLRDPSAKAGRELYRAVVQLKREVEEKNNIIEGAIVVSGLALGMVGTISGSMGALEDAIQALRPFLKSMEIGVKAGEPPVGALPYIGRVLKALMTAFRLFVLKAGQSLLKTIYNTLVKRQRPKLESFEGALSKLDGLLSSVSAILLPLPALLGATTFIAINLHKCAFEQDQLGIVAGIEDFMEVLKGFIKQVTDMLSAIALDGLRALDLFYASGLSLLAYLNPFRGTIEFFRRLLSPFQFLVDLSQLTITIPSINFFFFRTPRIRINLLGLIGFVLNVLGSGLFGLILSFIPVDSMIADLLIPKFGLAIVDLDLSRFALFDIDLGSVFDGIFDGLVGLLDAVGDFVDSLAEKLPSELVVCNLGDETADLILDTGLDSAQTSRRSLQSSSDLHEAYVDFERIGYEALFKYMLPSNDDDDDDDGSSTRGSSRRRSARRTQLDAVKGPPRVFYSPATGLTWDVKGLEFDINGDGSDMAFKVSSNMQVKPPPKPGTSLYLEFTQLVTVAEGRIEEAQRCYMGVDKNGHPKPLATTVRKTRQSFSSIIRDGLISSKILPLEFKPQGNPYDSFWKVELEARVRNSLPGQLRTSCPQCPFGARCKNPSGSSSSGRRRRQLVKSGVNINLKSTAYYESAAQVLKTQLEDKGPHAVNPFFNPKTFGVCLFKREGELLYQYLQGDHSDDEIKTGINALCDEDSPARNTNKNELIRQEFIRLLTEADVPCEEFRARSKRYVDCVGGGWGVTANGNANILIPVDLAPWKTRSTSVAVSGKLRLTVMVVRKWFEQLNAMQDRNNGQESVYEEVKNVISQFLEDLEQLDEWCKRKDDGFPLVRAKKAIVDICGQDRSYGLDARQQSDDNSARELANTTETPLRFSTNLLGGYTVAQGEAGSNVAITKQRIRELTNEGLGKVFRGGREVNALPIHMYTSLNEDYPWRDRATLFYKLNEDLRPGDPTAVAASLQRDFLTEFTFHFIDSMRLIPLTIFRPKVYRGLSFEPSFGNDLLQRYTERVGQTIVWFDAISTSASEKAAIWYMAKATRPVKILMEISNVQTARYVKAFSVFKFEEEYLYLPGTAFEVVSVSQQTETFWNTKEDDSSRVVAAYVVKLREVTYSGITGRDKDFAKWGLLSSDTFRCPFNEVARCPPNQ